MALVAQEATTPRPPTGIRAGGDGNDGPADGPPDPSQDGPPAGMEPGEAALPNAPDGPGSGDRDATVADPDAPVDAHTEPEPDTAVPGARHIPGHVG